jgi:serine/threonine protein kinase
MSETYKSRFKEVESIGSGGFSTVFKVISIKDGKEYAIKKIPFNEEMRDKTLKEIQFLSKLNSDYVVQYIHSWIEENYYIPYKQEYNLDPMSLLVKPPKPLLLHIQMELCSMSLNEFIQQLNYTTVNRITPENYSIVCDIFLQILKSIHYLHSQNPSIIHRDLKPDNIMLIKSNENEFRVKLTDFGISTYHEYAKQMHTKYVGTEGFRAPELNSNDYDIKSDVYSLGFIMQLLFNFDHNK